MKLDQHYVEPRLVELYDLENPCGADTDFYLHLAADLKAKRIIDLGCGTGLLTRELALTGREVLGVDPAPAMLAYAQRQSGADRVQWIEGDSAVLGAQTADLVIMTGHVAQVFLEDNAWKGTLRHIHAALKRGGHLAFESRNPTDKVWERWHPDSTWQCLDTPFGPVESWLEVVHVANGKVSFRGHNIFADTGEEIVVDSTLRFRSQTELMESLHQAGFTVEHIYGGWQCQPFGSQSPIMVFVAKRP